MSPRETFDDDEPSRPRETDAERIARERAEDEADIAAALGGIHVLDVLKRSKLARGVDAERARAAAEQTICGHCGNRYTGESCPGCASRDADERGKSALIHGILSPDGGRKETADKGSYCGQCGTRNPSGSRFCGQCGAKQIQLESQRQAPARSATQTSEPVAPPRSPRPARASSDERMSPFHPEFGEAIRERTEGIADRAIITAFSDAARSLDPSVSIPAGANRDAVYRAFDAALQRSGIKGTEMYFGKVRYTWTRGGRTYTYDVKGGARTLNVS